MTKAGKKWLTTLIETTGEWYVVEIPRPHKDLNDWTKSGGAVVPDIEAAIEHANLETQAPAQPLQTTKAEAKSAKQAPGEAALKEEQAARAEECAHQVAKTINAFYDCVRKEYPLREATAVYHSLSEGQFKRVLRFHHVSTEIIQNRGWSQADIVIRHLQQNRYVNYVGPLAGRSLGYYQENGIPFLVTASPTLIEPAAGDWPTISLFLKNLLRF